MTRLAVGRFSFMVMVLAASGAQAADWAPGKPPLSTPWTDKVPVDHPLPEYPRPQLTRPDWQNLNGLWDLAITPRSATEPAQWPMQIRVPFAVESALSGVQRPVGSDQAVWYRRKVDIPADWSGRHVKLNFGAVDQQTTVWVNGKQAGETHVGGYDSFGYDITDALKPGANTIVIRVYDPTDDGQGALGKQRLKPDGIWYTPTTGIWQTVWLEPVAPVHIERMDMTADLDHARLVVVPHLDGGADTKVRVTVTSKGTKVGEATGIANGSIDVPVPHAHPWTPDDPFLYDVKAEVLDGGKAVDTVGSYIGMRTMKLAKVGKFLRPVLNGKFVFQMGALDQGFWPDGIYTAPTDEALRSDIDKAKAMGLNLLRKHIKIEPQRWYYWADHLGILVWQDMPATRDHHVPDSAGKKQFEHELHTIIEQLRNTTSIVTWVPMNEGWGEYDPDRLADEVKKQDPTRLVSNNSGSNCCGFDGGNGDFKDDHIYVGPGETVPTATRAASLGEFGGLGLVVPGHLWPAKKKFDYEDQADAKAMTTRYEGLLAKVARRVPFGLSAAIYTQMTDVETELNGYLTYDRKVMKMPVDRVRKANQAAIDAAKEPDQ
ncbi:glycoside hydrolase family 2 protein [Pinirhizobacter sp.]|uniref:glycoside hydrolase family 2 protein n=1 Tax=Pinirhizobacter sp. TaxID=2950432 RepID=UPI002F41611F